MLTDASVAVWLPNRQEPAVNFITSPLGNLSQFHPPTDPYVPSPSSERFTQVCQQRCTIRSAHRDVEATDAYSKQDSGRMRWRRMVMPFSSSCCASRLSKSPNPQSEASSLPNQSKLERHDWYKPSVIITSKASLDANHHLYHIG